MSDWQPLREHLAALVDQKIADEPDREARAVLAYHRDRVIDQLELIALRDILTQRGQQDAEPAIVRLTKRLNGSTATVQ